MEIEMTVSSYWVSLSHCGTDNGWADTSTDVCQMRGRVWITLQESRSHFLHIHCHFREKNCATYDSIEREAERRVGGALLLCCRWQHGDQRDASSGVSDGEIACLFTALHTAYQYLNKVKVLLLQNLMSELEKCTEVTYKIWNLCSIIPVVFYTCAGASQLPSTAYDHCILSTPPWRTETADSAVVGSSCCSSPFHLTPPTDTLCSTDFTKSLRLAATIGRLLWWSRVRVKGQLCGMEKNSLIVSLSSGEIPAILVSSLMIVKVVSKP